MSVNNLRRSLLLALLLVATVSADAGPADAESDGDNTAESADKLFHMSEMDSERSSELAADDEQHAEGGQCSSGCSPASSQVTDDDESDQDNAAAVLSPPEPEVQPNHESDTDKFPTAQEAVQVGEPWSEPNNRLSFVKLVATGFRQHYENQYDKINAYLVNELPDNVDVAENLAKAREWLEQELKRGVSILRNQVTVEALEQFLKLASLQEEGVRCSRQAYEILWKNDRATRGRAYKPPSQMGVSRRIDTVVHRAAVVHAITCFNVYPVRLQELRDTMDKRPRRLVETFTDNLMQSCDCDRTLVKSLRSKRATELAYELISKNSHDDPDRRFLGRVTDELKAQLVVRESGVRALVERYIGEPCRQFVWLLGPDVFIPAQFGALVFEKEDRYDDSHGDFIHTWRQYRLCQTLIRNDKESLIKSLVKYIWKITAKA